MQEASMKAECDAMIKQIKSDDEGAQLFIQNKQTELSKTTLSTTELVKIQGELTLIYICCLKDECKNLLSELFQFNSTEMREYV